MVWIPACAGMMTFYEGVSILSSVLYPHQAVSLKLFRMSLAMIILWIWFVPS